MNSLAVFLLLLPLAASAYSPHDILLPTDIPSRDFILPKDSLTDAEVRSDMDILIEAFTNGYGGFKNFRLQFENQFFPQLREPKSRSTQSLCNDIGLIFDQINDNHLSIRYAGATSKCSGAPTRQGQVGHNIQTDTTLPWGYFERMIGKRKVAIVSILRSPLRTSESWQGFLEKARDVYAHADALIIDLRGNGGGDDGKLEEFAKIIYGLEGKNVTLAPPGSIERRQTPESYALFANTFFLRMLKDRWDGKPAATDLAGYHNDFLQLFELAVKDHLSPVGITQFQAPNIDLSKAFKGPVRILIDGGCASSCENGVEFFEKFPGVKRVGENTGGFVHFGNVGTLLLKNSHLIVSIPTQSYTYEDGRFVEKIGYAPDIHVSPGSDALESALRDLN